MPSKSKGKIEKVQSFEAKKQCKYPKSQECLEQFEPN
jgi:hypothetical protein